MYLNKYDIKGETYVKLDELNDLMKKERKQCMKAAKKAKQDGTDDKVLARVTEHGAIVQLARKVNMSENGENYVIFTRDKNGNWEFLVDVVAWKDVPDYIKSAAKTKTDWVTFGTSEIDEATLYETFEEAEAELRRVVEKTGSEEWHMTRKWMFDTKENRESLLALFYDGGEEDDDKPDEKAEAIKRAENAIERTRAALDKTEKLLAKVKDEECEKSLEAAQKPPKRKVSCPGRYTVWYRNDEDTTLHCMGFVRFEKGIPVFTNRPCKATWFVWRNAAEKVAEKCGDGFEVVDMFGQMTPEQRLLRAIFREDGMDGEDDEPEYHGDGTSAEDEDWDGDTLD